MIFLSNFKFLDKAAFYLQTIFGKREDLMGKGLADRGDPLFGEVLLGEEGGHTAL